MHVIDLTNVETNMRKGDYEMWTYSYGSISGCDCNNVCTWYNAWTNALHLRLRILYDFIPSHRIQIVRCPLLALNGGGIIKQDWCIAPLQLISYSGEFLLFSKQQVPQEEQKFTGSDRLEISTWTKQSWKWRRIRDAAILCSRDTAVLTAFLMVLRARGQVWS